MTGDNIQLAAEKIEACFREGGKLLLCGNGGSAADCAHILGEFVKGFRKRRPLSADMRARIGEAWADALQCGLPAIDLTCNNALISAVINDIGGEYVFAQQVMAYARRNDVIIGISTSGNAENVRRALSAARALGAYAIAMTGQGGGKLAGACDLLISAPHTQTYLVQEAHIKYYHEICMRVEDALFSA